MLYKSIIAVKNKYKKENLQRPQFLISNSTLSFAQLESMNKSVIVVYWVPSSFSNFLRILAQIHPGKMGSMTLSLSFTCVGSLLRISQHHSLNVDLAIYWNKCNDVAALVLSSSYPDYQDLTFTNSNFHELFSALLGRWLTMLYNEASCTFLLWVIKKKFWLCSIE